MASVDALAIQRKAVVAGGRARPASKAARAKWWQAPVGTGHHLRWSNPAEFKGAARVAPFRSALLSSGLRRPDALEERFTLTGGFRLRSTEDRRGFAAGGVLGAAADRRLPTAGGVARAAADTRRTCFAQLLGGRIRPDVCQ